MRASCCWSEFGRLCYQCDMGWRARVMAAVSVLLAAALSVTVGVAVGVLPKSWRPYLWMAWPISVALALAYASIAARPADAVKAAMTGCCEQGRADLTLDHGYWNASRTNAPSLSESQYGALGWCGARNHTRG